MGAEGLRNHPHRRVHSVIGAGGREYLKGIKKVGRREYESVTELPNNELWQGEGLTKSNQL